MQWLLKLLLPLISLTLKRKIVSSTDLDVEEAFEADMITTAKAFTITAIILNPM
jgi:hypothetical protein